MASRRVDATAADEKLSDRSPSGDEDDVRHDGKVQTAYGELEDPDVELSEEERLAEVRLFMIFAYLPLYRQNHNPNTTRRTRNSSENSTST